MPWRAAGFIETLMVDNVKRSVLPFVGTSIDRCHDESHDRAHQRVRRVLEFQKACFLGWKRPNERSSDQCAILAWPKLGEFV